MKDFWSKKIKTNPSTQSDIHWQVKARTYSKAKYYLRLLGIRFVTSLKYFSGDIVSQFSDENELNQSYQISCNSMTSLYAHHS